MSRKVFLAVLVLVLVLVPVSSALAQGDLPPVPCGQLSEEDCAILTQAQLAMMELSSASMEANLDMAFDVVDAGEPQSFAFGLGLSGAAAWDMSALQPFMGMDPEMMDMTQSMTMLVDALRAVQANMVMNLSIPEELMAEAGMPGGLPPIEIVFVDGVGYVNVGALMPADASGADAQMPPWMGIDIAGMYEQLFAEMDGEMMDEAFMDAQSELTQEMVMAMSDPEFYNEFISITRLDDAEVDGQTMAVFQTTLDYEAMFSSETFQQVFGDYMDTVLEMEGMTMEETGLSMDEMNDALVAMMSGITLNYVEWVGVDDFYTHHSEMALSFAFDEDTLAAFVPEGEMMDSDMPSSFSMTFNMTADLSNFNEPVEVTAPEGAQVINPMMFMDMAPTTTG